MSDFNIRFEENILGAAGFRLEVDELLAQEKSDWQTINIFTNKLFGRVLTLDGIVQCTTLDEHIYHEMMAHVACNIKRNQEGLNVAIIGGGDGGVLREVLKYDNVSSATLIDIDERVIKLSEKYLPSMSDNAFTNERATILSQDGALWLKNHPKDLDIIFIDSSDDDSDASNDVDKNPNSSLFNDEFYSSVRNALKEDGIVVKQSGCLLIQERESLRTCSALLRAGFTNTGLYRQNVPTYVGGDMCFVWASNLETYPGGITDLKHIAVDDVSETNIPTKYYNKDVHYGAFAMPQEFKVKLNEVLSKHK